MGVGAFRGQGPQKIRVRQPDGSVIPVSVEDVGAGKVKLTREDGSAIITAMTQVPTPEGTKTVFVPLANPYMGGLNSIVTLPEHSGVISGAQNYYVCAGQLPQDGGTKAYLPGHTNNPYKGKCEVVWNNKVHNTQHSSVIRDDGNYTWTREPTQGVSFGKFNDADRPICRAHHDGSYFVGYVDANGKCVASAYRNIIQSDDYDYLDHPLDQQ